MWIELRPEPSAPHPFATVDIAPGSVVDGSNTQARPVPVGTFTPVELGKTALRSIPSGDPVLASALGDPGQAVPEGWWSLEITVPRGAQSGDAARIVLLDGDHVASGVVVEGPGDDPLGSGHGLVAVEPDRAAEVARAAGEGRAVVMIAPS